MTTHPARRARIVGIVRVHGISGINGNREFNRLLELVRTMPG
ncbi:MAG: hypothetical protein NT142_07820 [Planctomycetota bacterium]|nr:hypothetical protein [Planctomycetota bacterium]